MENYRPEKKIKSPDELGAPVNPEAIPEKELFKASLSFDFVFTEKTAKCILIVSR